MDANKCSTHAHTVVVLVAKLALAVIAKKAMLSSYTLLSRAPAPKFSPATAAATLQLRKQLPPPAVASSVAALRWASLKESRRAPLFVRHCLAGGEKGVKKYTYDIQPSALQNAPTSASAGEDWNVMGDKDLVILKLRVGDLSAKDKVAVRTTADQTHLEIKYTGDTNDEIQASKLNVLLALPPGYGDGKVLAWWFDGWLVILIAKPKPGPKKIDIPTN